MKKYIGFGIGLAVVIGLIASGTWGVFTDTETSSGNTIVAGTIDIAVNGDDPIVDGCNIEDIKPCQTGWITVNVTNVGTNPCELWKHIENVVNTDNDPVDAEQAFYDAWHDEHEGAPEEEWPENWKISDWIHYDMVLCRGEACEELIAESDGYHLDDDVDNWGQDDKITFDIDFVAQQVEGGLPDPPGPVLPGYGRP